jgi:hypothetical protein
MPFLCPYFRTSKKIRPDEKILYFASTKGDPKEKNFRKIITWHLPQFHPEDWLIFGRIMQRLKKAKKQFSTCKIFPPQKMPWYKDNIDKNGKTMNLYKARFATATVLAGPDKSCKIAL